MGSKRQGSHRNPFSGSKGEIQPGGAWTTEPVVSHLPDRGSGSGVCPPYVCGLGPGLELIEASLPEVVKPGIAPWISALRDHSSAPKEKAGSSFFARPLLKMNRGNAVVFGPRPGRGHQNGGPGVTAGAYPVDCSLIVPGRYLDGSQQDGCLRREGESVQGLSPRALRMVALDGRGLAGYKMPILGSMPSRRRAV